MGGSRAAEGVRVVVAAAEGAQGSCVSEWDRTDSRLLQLWGGERANRKAGIAHFWFTSDAEQLALLLEVRFDLVRGGDFVIRQADVLQSSTVHEQVEITAQLVVRHVHLSQRCTALQRRHVTHQEVVG
eukprot:scaffold24568_cov70-Phaeocystis_antarctica.AAC.2